MLAWRKPDAVRRWRTLTVGRLGDCQGYRTREAAIWGDLMSINCFVLFAPKQSAIDTPLGPVPDIRVAEPGCAYLGEHPPEQRGVKMRELSKYLLLLSLLSWLIVNAPAAVEALGGGGFHGGGDTMIFIPPSGGGVGGGGANSPGLHYGGANQIGNRGGRFDIEKRGGGHYIGGDGNIRQRDVSGKYKGNATRSDRYMRHRINDDSVGRSKRSGTRHLSRSDFEASRKHQNLGVKKRHGHYKGGGKSRTV